MMKNILIILGIVSFIDVFFIASVFTLSSRLSRQEEIDEKNGLIFPESVD